MVVADCGFAAAKMAAFPVSEAHRADEDVALGKSIAVEFRCDGGERALHEESFGGRAVVCHGNTVTEYVVFARPADVLGLVRDGDEAVEGVVVVMRVALARHVAVEVVFKGGGAYLRVLIEIINRVGFVNGRDARCPSVGDAIADGIVGEGFGGFVGVGDGGELAVGVVGVGFGTFGGGLRDAFAIGVVGVFEESDYLWWLAQRAGPTMVDTDGAAENVVGVGDDCAVTVGLGGEPASCGIVGVGEVGLAALPSMVRSVTRPNSS